MHTTPFLTAHWHYLAMINYEVPAEILEPMVPKGTRLDRFEGKVLASMVGFLFHDTKLKGIPIPFHRHFEEVNLRFYVVREEADEVKRGVVFVKEIVPKPALSLVARVVYNENYVTMPMDHRVVLEDANREVVYRWQHQKQWNHLKVIPRGEASIPTPGSEGEFITEHYWGYAIQRHGGTVEYRVAHPQWDVWEVDAWEFDCDVAGIYGPQFAETLNGKPSSAFLARGSEVTVFSGHKLKL